MSQQLEDGVPAAAGAEDAGQDSVDHPAQGRNAVPANPVLDEGEQDRQTFIVKLTGRAYPDLTNRGFDVEEFDGYDDFESACLAMTEWIRDQGLYCHWGLWQVLMKELSVPYADTCPDRNDPELNTKI